MKTPLSIAAALMMTVGTAGLAHAADSSQATGTTGVSTGTQIESHTAASGVADWDQSRVRDLQQSLKDAGHDLSADGQWGPETEQALRDFQRDQGLDATGRPDHGTMAALAGQGTDLERPQQAMTPDDGMDRDRGPDRGAEGDLRQERHEDATRMNGPNEDVQDVR